MIGILDILNDRASPRAFYKIEKDLTGQFAEAENIRQDYMGLEKKRDKEQEALEQFNEENAHLPDDNLSSQHNSKSLQWRKWATVAIDAIVSLAAIKLFFLETVNLEVAFLPSVVLGVCVAYLLLKLAISYRHYDAAKVEQDSFTAFWMKYSYILPLLIIPTLSLYLIIHSPGNPANYIWVAFLVFSFLLNMKAASYSTQYVEMEQVKAKVKVQKSHQKRIDEINQSIGRLQTKLQRIVNNIRRKATDYRREYERFSEKNRPELYLHISYRFVLNTRVYFYDVLPIPQPLKITREPNGPIGSLCDWWDTATNNPQPYNGSNTIEEAPEPFKLTGNPVNNKQEAAAPNVENGNTIEPEQEVAEENEGFGKIISDNEKFV
ncbi:MAG: hypothetical protein IH594_02715 [Bacteroidales bacterium]|nr:hypothetical protein [Bacteroidales bacterium]